MDPFFDYEDLGHQFNFDHVLLELYRLVCQVFASKEFAIQAAEDPNRQFMGPDGKATNPLEALDNQFFSNEASRLMLFVAIAMRSLDDRLPTVFDQFIEETCGEVTEDNGKSQRLGLREACNKLIHARQYVNFDFHTLEPQFASPKDNLSLPPIYVLPRVHLKGEQPAGKKSVPWEATIDLIAFAGLVVKCVKFHQVREKAAHYR